MIVNKKHYRSVWIDKENKKIISVIDQTKLPHKFVIKNLKSSNDLISAIKNMLIRGAPLIGVVGAYGIYLACLEAKRKTRNLILFQEYLKRKSKDILSTRPTAVNLFNIFERMTNEIEMGNSPEEKIDIAFRTANKIADEDAEMCRMIGINGVRIIENLYRKKKRRINILTHCNAGWLATTDYGTALSPVYLSHSEKIPVHVWVEETRPRNQGGELTVWELNNQKIPNTLITDNAGGYVMQKGMVDAVIVGSDRTSIRGDVCNKIGTYKTALAAKDNKIPFYAVLLSTSFDFKIKNAFKEIPIEERDINEVKYVKGKYKNKIINVLITIEDTNVKNYGFDITPASLITGLITEKGIIRANEREIKKFFISN